MSRKTYVYDPESGEMVEGHSPSRIDGHSGDGWRFSDRLYSAAPFVGVDGKVIDSKKKHREYMRRHNLTTADDFKGTWAQKQQEREAFYTRGADPTRKEDIRRALEKRRSS